MAGGNATDFWIELEWDGSWRMWLVFLRSTGYSGTWMAIADFRDKAKGKPLALEYARATAKKLGGLGIVVKEH